MTTTSRPGLGTSLAVALLLVCFAAQAILSMRDKSVTVDEITYIAAGYYHLTTGDFEYNMTNPPLMKMWAGLPLLALDPDLPETGSDPSTWDAIEEWQYARRFLYDNRVDADRLLFAARLPFVGLGVLLGFFVFSWARQLYGDASGLLALFLFCFCPNLLAHTRLTTQDLGVAFIVFTSAYCFWKYTTQRRIGALLASAALAGCGLLTKSTAGFVAPIFALYFALCALRSRDFGIDSRLPFVDRFDASHFRQRQVVTALGIAAVYAVVSLAVINVGYGFQGSFEGLPLVPSAFAQSILFQLRLSSFGGVFLAGEIYSDSLWYIILITIALKTPLPVLALTGFGGARTAVAWRNRSGETLLLCAIGVFIALFMVLNNLGTILRYVLPIFPFAFVLAGRLATESFARPRLAHGFLAAMCLWHLVGSLRVGPHYLAYFNELAGGPAGGHRYLAESNLDWGQDLKGLKTYMVDHGIDRIQLGYFGSADADYYGIDYDYLPSVGLAPREPGQLWWYEIDPESARSAPRPHGLMAVSVSLIQGYRWLGPLFEPTYGFLRGKQPLATIGHTIHIYDVAPPGTTGDEPRGAR